MRKINYIVLHCSANKAGSKITARDIELDHIKNRGFRKIGYHYVIHEDGRIVPGRSLDEAGAHVAGNNSNSIGICYVGGLDAKGKPADTRTPEQKASMLFLLEKIKEQYPAAKICGHRDFSPDLNGNGIIDTWEYMKACPCFDAVSEYKKL